MVKGPPYKTALPYFKRDVEAYCNLHRNTWTNQERTCTIDTLWYGDRTIQDYYTARIGRHRLLGLPAPNSIPAHPYQQVDVAAARANHTLPAQRDGVGNPIVPVPVPVPAPVLAPPPRPVNNYPYDFWPPEPWDEEPEDAILSDTPPPSPKSKKRHAPMKGNPDMWPLQDESAWRSGAYLGRGAFGSAGLWCRLNIHGDVEERMVTKEVVLDNNVFRVPCAWRDGVPREIRIHQLIDANRLEDSGEGFDNLIRHYGYRLMMQQKRYKIHLEFCEFGDLWRSLDTWFKSTWKIAMDARKLAEKKRIEAANMTAASEPPKSHESINSNETTKPNETTNSNETINSNETKFEDDSYGDDDIDHLLRMQDLKVIPEAFVWYIIREVSNACAILQTGILPPETPPEDWRPITHLDIATSNIFLRPSTASHGLPTAVWSDFGLSFYEHSRGDASTSDNPAEYVRDSEVHRFAPEQQWVRRTADGTPIQLGERTDIWSIGSVIFNLLTNTHPHEPRRDYQGPGDDHIRSIMLASGGEYPRMGEPGQDFPFGHHYPAILRYSEELRLLMAKCLNYEPEHRPSLAELRDAINDWFNAKPDALEDMMADNELFMLKTEVKDGLKVGDRFRPKRRKV